MGEPTGIKVNNFGDTGGTAAKRSGRIPFSFRLALFPAARTTILRLQLPASPARTCPRWTAPTPGHEFDINILALDSDGKHPADGRMTILRRRTFILLVGKALLTASQGAEDDSARVTL